MKPMKFILEVTVSLIALFANAPKSLIDMKVGPDVATIIELKNVIN